MMEHLRTDSFLFWGLVSTAAMVAIVIQSVSPIRHAFYESFLHIHQLLAFSAVAGIVLHCELQALPQRPFMYALISLWGLERSIRLYRIFYRRGTKVLVEALEGGACRVTFNIRGSWPRSPGKHVYAYIPTVSLWMSHPFSVAWIDEGLAAYSCPPNLNGVTLRDIESLSPTSSTSSGLETELKELPPRRVVPKNHSARTEISCIVASRTGMTATLYRRAQQSPTKAITFRAFVEGPYGGMENMRSYGTVLLFAGGVGITHQISVLRDLVVGFADGTGSTRKAVLLWSVHALEQLSWIRAWIDDLSRMPRRGCELKSKFSSHSENDDTDSAIVLLFVTRTNMSRGDGATVMKEVGYSEVLTFGRMNVQEMVRKEFDQRVGAMSVGVCGPGGLADDVRAATRAVMDIGNVDFWEESFTW
jgi:Ferric reductase NAD binding domain/Ferric reductase like transmembrane component/FAD-binding domain